MEESGTLRIGKREHKGVRRKGASDGVMEKVTERESVKEGGRICNM